MPGRATPIPATSGARCPDMCNTWPTAPAEVALQLQRPLSNDALTIVARGERKDEAGDLAA